jgi:hypothetical protein
MDFFFSRWFVNRFVDGKIGMVWGEGGVSTRDRVWFLPNEFHPKLSPPPSR